MPNSSQEKNRAILNFSEIWPRIVEALGTSKGVKIAAIVGIHPSSVSQWKKKQQLPALENILSIAQYRGYSIHWLLTGEGEKLVTPVTKRVANESEQEQITAEFISQFHNLPDEVQAAIGLRLVKDISHYLQETKEPKKKTEPIVEQNNFLMSDPKGTNAGTKRRSAAARKDIEDAQAFVEREIQKDGKN